MPLTKIAMRVCGGAIGLIAGVAALFLPLLFCVSQYDEMESAKQYGGHASTPGAIGGTLVVLAICGFLGLISYVFIRYAFRGDDCQR
jgi:hypothetical protein